jgi:hypothetical protein
VLRLFSIVCHIVAGIFLYDACLLAYLDGFSVKLKIVVAAMCLVPAIVALIFGLWLTNFQSWKRDVGVVLLSTSALSGFFIMMLACLLGTDEFQVLGPMEGLVSFSGSLVGSLIIAGLAISGWMLLRCEVKRAALRS